MEVPEELEKRIKVLEDDSKLVKGEIKTSVMNLRDFLKELKLPPDPGDSDGGNGGADRKEKNEAAPSPRARDMEPPSPQTQPARTETLPEEPRFNREKEMKPSFFNERPQMRQARPREMEPPAPEPEFLPSSGNDMPFRDEVKPFEPKEHPTTPEKKRENRSENRESEPGPVEPARTPAEINPMVNLIHWVAAAKREIGEEKLPVLLDVYAIGGKLATELREIILHLADVIDEKPNIDGSAADFIRLFRDETASFLDGYRECGKITPEVKDAILAFFDAAVMQTGGDKAERWGKLLLELHGILAGNEALFIKKGEPEGTGHKGRAQGPEESKNGETPLKLKLVVPDGKGGEKELMLNLSPEGDKNR